MASVYNFDPTGTSSANRIVNEQHVITAVNFRDYHYVIPKFAPFFQHNFQIRIQFPDQSVRTLIEGQDYYLSNQFLDASRACAKPIYGSISFLDTNLYGIMSISYNTVGGIWNLSPAEITRILAEEMRNPRTTTWEQITYLPERFPVVDHEWDLVDMVGASSLVESIDSVRDAVLAANGGGLAAHTNRLDNPHAVTKSQVGLGAVQNYGIATPQQAQLGTSNNLYMTPLTTAAAINTIGQALVTAHENRKDNPHAVTKTQVGLGNVPNYPVATEQEAVDGTSDDRFMTPLKVSKAIGATAGSLASHINNKNNPHNTTKDQVGLFNLENYPVATEQEARAGVSNARYMTPLRTMQLCREFVAVQLDGHAMLTNNPHAVDKSQVGLGLVQNYGIATVDEMREGTANNKYVTPALVKAAVAAFSGNAADHITATNNPHAVTAEQVGAYTRGETDHLLNGKLGSLERATDSAKFGGYTVTSYAAWLRDNLTEFNAAYLGGKSIDELTDDILYQTAAQLRCEYQSTATGTHTWIKLGWLEGIPGNNSVNPATAFIVSGGERETAPSQTGDTVAPLFVRASLRTTNSAGRPIVEAQRLFTSGQQSQITVGSTWAASTRRLTLWAKVPVSSRGVYLTDVAGRKLNISQAMEQDGAGFEESVTEPSGIVYATVVGVNSDQLGGKNPDHYATAQSLQSLTTTVTNQGSTISSHSTTLSSQANALADLTARVTTIENLLNSINVE